VNLIIFDDNIRYDVKEGACGKEFTFKSSSSRAWGDLAEAVGATRQTIGLIEAGKYNPSLALCIAICKTLDRTLDQLFWEN